MADSIRRLSPQNLTVSLLYLITITYTPLQYKISVCKIYCARFHEDIVFLPPRYFLEICSLIQYCDNRCLRGGSTN